MKPRTFILCVGAQKAGTTWLDHYLRAHPGAQLGPIKEWQVFNVHTYGLNPWLQERLQNALKQPAPPSRWALLKAALSFRARTARPAKPALLWARFLADTEAYFDYFASLLDQNEHATLTGDITPSYASLPARTLVDIRQGLISRGFAVRVVFLMRDPVERCISAAKHMARQTFKQHCPEGIAIQDWRGRLPTQFTSPGFEQRTRYDLTIRHLEQAFAPEELHYAFFEELFNDASIEALTRFLGIDFKPGAYGVNSHPAHEGGDIDPALRRQIRQHYDEVYRFVAERFGAERMERLWAANWRIEPASSARSAA